MDDRTYGFRADGPGPAIAQLQHNRLVHARGARALEPLEIESDHLMAGCNGEQRMHPHLVHREPLLLDG